MNKGINVLSLFDGMSCGQIALQRLGMIVEQYFASEIDKNAVKVSKSKWPNMIHLGSVVDVHAKDLPKIDLLIGGSPCQGFSNAGKGLNFEDPRSKLFFEFVRLLEEIRKVNPNVLFMLENVRMKKEWEDVISRLLEIQPICINSELVSAQHRERLYWTNIAMKQHGLFSDNYCSIPQPKDKGILLKSILEKNVDKRFFLTEKAIAYLDRGATKNWSDRLTFMNDERNPKSVCVTANFSKGIPHNMILVYDTDVVHNSFKGGQIRRMTPIECCRLQTVSDNYFFNGGGGQIVADGHIYKMCGNGWNVDTIVHILSFAKLNS